MPKSNLAIYCKSLQKIHQIKLEIDDKAVIIKYKSETIINEHRIAIQSKEALLNFLEAIPRYLVFLYDYFPNRYPNNKRLYSKFHILCNQYFDKIILVIKNEIMDCKSCTKHQPL